MISSKIKDAIQTCDQYELSIDTDDISIDGQNQIRSIVYNDVADSDALPNYTFDWRFETDRGKLPKRIRSFVYKATGAKLSDDACEKIGNIAQMTRFYGSAFYFDFCAQANWNRGDFGDPDSCYWTNRNKQRIMMNGNDRTAFIRFYTDKDYDIGWGRAILILDFPNIGDVTAINSYPKGFQITNVGRIIHKWMNVYHDMDKLYSKRVQLRYEDSWHGKRLYINGGNAVIISPKMIRQPKYDLLSFNGYNLYQCLDCGEAIYTNITIDNNPTNLCERCADKRYSYCRHCGKWFVGKETLCTDCSTKVSSCSFCGRYALLKCGGSVSLRHTKLGIERTCYNFSHDFVVCSACMFALRSAVGGPLIRQNSSVLIGVE